MTDKPGARAPSATARTPFQEPGSQISLSDLAGQLFRKRKGRGLTLEQASEQIGVSAATLSRLERLRHQDKQGDTGRGHFVPDTRTLTAVARWLDVPPLHVVGFDAPEAPAIVGHRVEESVPDVVEAHLRADRNLDDEAALALARMFRMAYDQFSRLAQTDAATSRPTERTDDDA